MFPLILATSIWGQRFSFYKCSLLFHYGVIISLLASCSHQLVVFPRSQCDSNSLQVSRILLSILANPNNALIYMVSNLLIYNYSNLFFKPLGTVFSPPSRIGITISFMFHRFFSSLARSRYLYIFSFSSSSFFIFILQSTGIANFTKWQILFSC